MKDETVYLRHILDFISRIERYTAAGEVAFRSDEMRQDAVARNLELIGEAAKRLSAETRSRVPGQPWLDIMGMRDRLIHGYSEIDMDVVWETARDDLAPLKAAIQHVLADADG
jgi:uncharacterized protein with HEPN domain